MRRAITKIKTETKINKKLTKAVGYLKSIGCKEVFLFGSLSDGTFNELSDIDLAVSGISPRKYFKAVAALSSIAKWKVDLVALDYISEKLKERIRKEGKKLYAS